MGIENVTITRRMAYAFDGLQNDFRSLCDIKDFQFRLELVKKAGNDSNRPSELKKLFDMFEMVGIEYERGRENEYYEQLIQNSNIPDSQDLEDKMIYSLYLRYQKYPSPEEYMERLVNRFSKDEDWEFDSLRVRILKQFIKYGNYLYDAGIKGRKIVEDYAKERLNIKKKPTIDEVLQVIDENVFDVIEQTNKQINEMSRDKRKAERKRCELLIVADELASGKFRTGGITKKYLYLFAMAYGMTFYSERNETGAFRDEETDIEINLFRDYYTNNLIRFITDKYCEKKNSYDLDPSGQGINFKNFAEIIYLYFISKNYDKKTKIKLSSEMIERVKTNQLKKGKLDTKEKGGTSYYRNYFKKMKNDEIPSEDILSMDEEDFESFLCREYDCDTFQGRQLSPFQLENEQESAYQVYKSILEELNKADIDVNECKYGLWFTDIDSFADEKIERICKKYVDIKKDEFIKFIDLLEAANHFIRDKAFSVSSKERVSRTAIVTAYYYYYNAIHADDDWLKWKKLKKSKSMDDNELYYPKHKSFSEVYADFDHKLTEKLNEAYYQPFSSRNLLDVIVAFSSYAYINI